MYHKSGKYVTGLVRDFSNRNAWVDRHVAVLLPLNIFHDSVEMMFVQIKSAGFYSMEAKQAGQITIFTHGRSESLDVDGAPGDADLIKQALGLKEIPQ